MLSIFYLIDVRGRWVGWKLKIYEQRNVIIKLVFAMREVLQGKLEILIKIEDRIAIYLIYVNHLSKV